jgi:hypothetical protein
MAPIDPFLGKLTTFGTAFVTVQASKAAPGTQRRADLDQVAG